MPLPGMSDLANRVGNTGVVDRKAQNSTNKDAGKSLDMDDFQNQDIDNAASTSDMMNQMVQMSVVQAVTNMNTMVEDSTVLTYAASLVGKEVTIGQYVGKELKEIVGTVTGTGTLKGQQVIFIGDDSYYLSDIMAVGRLPDKETDVKPGGDENEDKDDTEEGGTPTEPEQQV